MMMLAEAWLEFNGVHKACVWLSYAWPLSLKARVIILRVFTYLFIFFHVFKNVMPKKIFFKIYQIL